MYVNEHTALRSYPIEASGRQLAHEMFYTGGGAGARYLGTVDPYALGGIFDIIAAPFKAVGKAAGFVAKTAVKTIPGAAAGFITCGPACAAVGGATALVSRGRVTQPAVGSPEYVARSPTSQQFVPSYGTSTQWSGTPGFVAPYGGRRPTLSVPAVGLPSAQAAGGLDFKELIQAFLRGGLPGARDVAQTQIGPPVADAVERLAGDELRRRQAEEVKERVLAAGKTVAPIVLTVAAIGIPLFLFARR